MVDFSSKDFTAVIIGGVFLALATSLLMLLYGKSTNVTAWFNQFIHLDRTGDFHQRYMFCAGMLAAPFLSIYIFDRGYVELFDVNISFYESSASTDASLKWYGWIIAGFCVGFGFKSAGGGLSLHALCDGPRLHARSLFVLLTFFISAVVFASIRNEADYMSGGESLNLDYNYVGYVIFAVITVLAIFFAITELSRIFELAIHWGLGLFFGYSMLIAQMCKPLTIQSSLIFIDKNWNPTILMIYGIAFATNLALWNILILKQNGPICGGSFEGVHNSSAISTHSIFGAIVAGYGYSLMPFNPASGLINLIILDYSLVWVASCAGGLYVANYLEDNSSKVSKNSLV